MVRYKNADDAPEWHEIQNKHAFTVMHRDTQQQHAEKHKGREHTRRCDTVTKDGTPSRKNTANTHTQPHTDETTINSSGIWYVRHS